MFRPSGRTQTPLTLCWKSLHGLRNTPKNHCQWTHRCIYTKFELDCAKIQIRQRCRLLTPVWPITTSRGIKRGGTEPVWQNEGASAHMHRGSLCICGGLINAECLEKHVLPSRQHLSQERTCLFHTDTYSTFSNSTAVKLVRLSSGPVTQQLKSSNRNKKSGNSRDQFCSFKRQTLAGSC